jgi:hypothetical protein
MPNLGPLFLALAKSTFRSRFRLRGADLAYLQKKGLSIILAHAADFIRARLASAQPLNDGKQTPMRGHPVFVAQHATATCCRSCLEKWHKIPKGRQLTPAEQQYIREVIEHWLTIQSPQSRTPSPNDPSLF